MLPLLGKAGIVDDPGFDRSMTLDPRLTDHRHKTSTYPLNRDSTLFRSRTPIPIPLFERELSPLSDSQTTVPAAF
jgi:hypothetical protein